jgi:Transposase IS116/IS110/IS902 family/Transposase
VLNRNLLNDPAELTALLGRLAQGTPVAFEAAYGWGWLADLLEELGLEPHLVHPNRCKAIASARLKHDKVDARTLAHLLRTDLLPQAWIAPQAVRDQRALLRHRVALVQVATSLRNRVHAVLADRGLRVEQRLWSASGRAWLAALDLPPVQRALVDDRLALIDALDPIVARLERDLRARAKPDPRVTALMALPGVGQITAMTLVAEIGDITRFATARKLCAWAGLTPQVRNLRPHRPPRPHHQTGLGGGALGAHRSRPAGQDPAAPRTLLRRVCSSPRRPDRHRRGRTQAARPLLPPPQPGPGHHHHHHQRRRSARRVRSLVSMRLQHGRLHD